MSIFFYLNHKRTTLIFEQAQKNPVITQFNDRPDDVYINL